MLLSALLIVFVFLRVTNQIFSTLLPTKSFLRKVVKGFLTVLNLLVGILLLIFAAIIYNESLREKLFYHFAVNIIAKPSPLDIDRCDLLSRENIRGKVMEIGFGPATNFRCWSNKNHISEWIGVDPNNLFRDYLEEEKVRQNITFPTSTIWKRGEDLDIPEESVDVVVGAHVLCSVDDVNEVLKQVARALKPGGKYYFMEHVAAKGETPEAEQLRFYQQLFQPLFNVIGKGCLFKRTWEYFENGPNSIHASGGYLKDFDIEFRYAHLNAPMPIIAPHILGVATKRPITNAEVKEVKSEEVQSRADNIVEADMEITGETIVG